MSDQKLDDELIRYFSDARLRPARMEEILQETAQLQRVSGMDSSEYAGDADVSKVQKGFRDRLSWLLKGRGGVRALALALPSFVALAVVVGFLLRAPDDGSQAVVADNAATPLLLSDLVFKEAALNHRSKFKYDVVASDVDSIVDGMHRLDFDVELPDALASGFELVGGRYCTLGGHLAAHIRLQERVPNGVYKNGVYGKANGLGSYSISSAQISDTERQMSEETVSLFQPRSRSLFVARTSPEFNKKNKLQVEVHDDVSVQSWTEGDLLYVLAEGDIQAGSVKLVNELPE